jgi:hypothetical protein
MGFFSKEAKEARSDLRDARRDLEENGRRERKAGIRDETPEYHRLNSRVIDAENRARQARRGR